VPFTSNATRGVVVPTPTLPKKLAFANCEVEDAKMPLVNQIGVEVLLTATPKFVEGVNGNAALTVPTGVVVAIILPLPSTARKAPVEVASFEMATTPDVEIEKRFVVEDEIANAGAVVAMPVTSTPSFANGVVEPMPTKLEGEMKSVEVAVSEVDAVA